MYSLVAFAPDPSDQWPGKDASVDKRVLRGPFRLRPAPGTADDVAATSLSITLKCYLSSRVSTAKSHQDVGAVERLVQGFRRTDSEPCSSDRKPVDGRTSDRVRSCAFLTNSRFPGCRSYKCSSTAIGLSRRPRAS